MKRYTYEELIDLKRQCLKEIAKGEHCDDPEISGYIPIMIEPDYLLALVVQVLNPQPLIMEEDHGRQV